MTNGFLIHPEELTDKMIDILREYPVDVLGIHPAGGVTANETLNRLLELMETRDYNAKLERVRALGIKVEFECHALSWLVPRELLSKYPEWFRLDKDGRRKADFNMCATNRDALDYLSQRSAELASKLKSDTGKYYFWIDDVDNSYCHCDNCRGLSASEQAMSIYNAILKGIKCVDANAKQCYLAYGEVIQPPVKVRPDEGIFAEYAPIRRDTKRPLTDEVNRVWLSQAKAVIDFFGSTDAKVLEYWIDNSMFSGYKKPPKKLVIDPSVVRADVAVYRSLGYDNITSFGCYLSDDYIQLYGQPPIGDYVYSFSSL